MSDPGEGRREMSARERRMVGHGAVVMVIGLLAGICLVMSLIGGFEVFPGEILEFEMPSDSEAWARAHVGGLMNGLLVLGGALLLWGMRIPDPLSRRLFWMLTGTGYANTIFYWGALFSDTRALTFGDNRFGETSVAGVIGLLPALIFAFVTTAAFVMLARHAFMTSRAASG